MNKLQAMEVFVQVVDAGGFTRAAENMQLPKATVSTLVQQLEQALQVKLLNRTTRQVSVTADGAAYYERCLRILSDVRDAEETLSKTKANPGGRLRVDVAASMATDLIIPALPGFFHRYPDIKLELGCGDRPVDLIEEGVDCAIRGGLLSDSSLIARRVGAMHFGTGATPEYLDKHGRPQHPRELTRHRCINYFSSKTGKIFPWDFSKDDETVSLDIPSCLAVNDSNAYTSAGLAGLGIMQIARYRMEPLVERGLVEYVLDDWITQPIPVNVVYPQNRHLSAKVRVFVEWVAELFADMPHMQVNRAPRRAVEI